MHNILIDSEFQALIPPLSAEERNKRLSNAEALALGQKYNALRSKEAEAAQKKSRWIASARGQFCPGEQRPCAVCQKHQLISQAHHLLPLHMQFEAGAASADQSFVWLCPTHHAYVHAAISARSKQQVELLLLSEPCDQKEAVLQIAKKAFCQANVLAS